MIITIPIILFFVWLAGFFSGSEIALVSLNRIRLKVLAEAKDSKAVMIQNMLNNPSRMLSTMLVGTNVAIVAATALFLNMIFGVFGDNAHWITTIVITPVILIFGEFIPKAIYAKKANKIVYFFAELLNFFWELLYPIVRVASFISESMLRVIGIRPERKKSPFVTREEIKYLIKESESRGIIKPHERNIIYKIFDFGRKKTFDMMNRLDTLVWFKPTDTIASLLENFSKTGYSRYPIKKEGEFVGLINVLDVIHETGKDKPLSGFIRPVASVDSNMPIDNVLMHLQSNKQHMAIVIDKDRKPVGFVTIEDLLEEIVGEI